MKILSNTVDSKSRAGSMRLFPTNLDDIYCLGLILKSGDKISSLTTRKVSQGPGKTQKKLTLNLTIAVESFEDDLHVGILNVKGKTCFENEYVKAGSYHSIEIKLHEEFTLSKKKWTDDDIDKINESTKQKPEICFVMFYEEETVVSSASSSEVKIISKFEVRKKKYSDIIHSVSEIKDKIKGVIIAGFSDIIFDFHKELSKADSGIELISTCIKLNSEFRRLSHTKLISRILADPCMIKSINNIKFVDDIRDLQRVFSKLDTSKDNVCIGLTEVGEAIDYGAVETLFVTDKFRKPILIKERKFADDIISKCKELRAKVCEIPTCLDLGERLDAMGGIVCTLKFEFK